MEEERVVQGGVGEGRRSARKCSKRRRQRRQKQGCTCLGKHGEQKRAQCEVKQQQAVNVWRGRCGGTEGNDVEQQRKAAWAWKGCEDSLEGARERTGDGVLVEHLERKDVDSLWAVLCALQSRQSSEEELKKIRQGVRTRVESRHNLSTMEECLPQEEVSWQRCVQRTRRGRRMGDPPEPEAGGTEGGYKVAVYRETKSGEGYRKLVEYGDGRPLDAGISVDQATGLRGSVGGQRSQE